MPLWLIQESMSYPRGNSNVFLFFSSEILDFHKYWTRDLNKAPNSHKKKRNPVFFFFPFTAFSKNWKHF